MSPINLRLFTNRSTGNMRHHQTLHTSSSFSNRMSRNRSSFILLTMTLLVVVGLVMNGMNTIQSFDSITIDKPASNVVNTERLNVNPNMERKRHKSHDLPSSSSNTDTPIDPTQILLMLNATKLLHEEKKMTREGNRGPPLDLIENITKNKDKEVIPTDIPTLPFQDKKLHQDPVPISKDSTIIHPPPTQDMNLQHHHRTVVFILTGAVRSLSKTYTAILHNLVLPLCPPTHCSSHLVAHLSYSDNRPDTKTGDARGRAITMNESDIQQIKSKLQDWFCSSSTEMKKNTDGPPKSFQFCHFVQPTYDISSLEEKQAMDQLEHRILEHDNNNDTTTIHVNRLRSLRYADPRRYSMWFSRYYAWYFIESTLPKYDTYEYMFLRPDLLWYLPFMDYTFIQTNTLSITESSSSSSSSNHISKEVWVHDSYYSATPDTFAYLPNSHVAKKYFSIEGIIQKGVGCLGGPDFNAESAKKRMMEQNIFVSGRDQDIHEKDNKTTSRIVPWCEDSFDGWSEQILMKKIFKASLQHRWIPAGSNLVRAHGPDCQPVSRPFLTRWAKHHASPIPFLICLMVQAQYNARKDAHDTLDLIQSVQPFHIRKRESRTTCVTVSSIEGHWEEKPCIEHPMDMRQIFSSYSDTSSLHVLWEDNRKIELNSSWHTLNSGLETTIWIKEYLTLYTSKTLQRK